MGFINWENKYDIGVSSMNDEHQKLIRLMNNVWNANDKGNKASTLESLDSLGTFVIEHFKNEEAFMESIDFPGLNTHKKIHEKLLADFSTHAKGFANDSSTKLSSAFFSFLKLWLSAHIQGIDIKYGEHHQKKAS